MDALHLDNTFPKSSYDVLSFERKLVELVEELRLRRSLEIESENNLKSLMDEKYKAEMEWDEKQSRHLREKDDLEQQISLLKRKLEDKVCVSDDEKAKQQVVNKTYSQEIRVLKEELKNSITEKLNLVKRLQELEGQLKLHTNFQETIVSQIADIRKRTRTLFDDCQALNKVQKNVLDNVSELKDNFRKYDINHQHLKQCVAIAERNSGELKRELISTRSEVSIFKNATMPTQRSAEKYTDTTKLQERISDLDNLLLVSRKENQKTLQNFVESNKQLNKYIHKYADAQEMEKSLSLQIKNYDSQLAEGQHRIDNLEEELMELKQRLVLENKQKEDRITVETQTSHDNECDTSRQADSSSTNEMSENKPKSKSCGPLQIVDSVLQNPEYQETAVADVTLTENPQPLQCTSSTTTCDEIGIFGVKVKRRFSMIEDEEDALEEAPNKKRLEDTTNQVNHNWLMNCKLDQNTMFDDISIPSSANSIDGICQSQEISVEDGYAINNLKNPDPAEENQAEASDLASVQMNLRGLKVDDALVSSQY